MVHNLSEIELFKGYCCTSEARVVILRAYPSDGRREISEQFHGAKQTVHAALLALRAPVLGLPRR